MGKEILELVNIVSRDRGIKNNKRPSKRNPRKKGLFGSRASRFIGEYDTLKVIPKSKRVKEENV